MCKVYTKTAKKRRGFGQSEEKDEPEKKLS